MAKTKKASGNGRAKKKATKAKQTRISGTFDPIPKTLQSKADKLDEITTERLALQQEENTRRTELAEMMVEQGIDRIPLDESTDLVLEDQGKRLKKKKKTEVGVASD